MIQIGLFTSLGLLLAMTQGPGTSTMGPEQVRELAEGLAQPDAKDRKEAAGALGRLGPKATAAVPALIVALGDEDGYVRLYAASALGKIGPGARSAIPDLDRLLRDRAETQSIRIMAATALGLIGPDALDHLVACLRDDQNPFARQQAAAAIGKVGPKAATAIPELIVALGDEDEGLWRNASESLIAVGTPAVSALACTIAAGHPLARVHAGRALLKIDPKHPTAIRAMVEDLQHGDVQVRTDAALALQAAAPGAIPELIPALAEALKDEDDFVRQVAAGKLAEVGPAAKPAIASLIEALRDPVPEVRGHSATALGKIGSEARAAVSALTRSLEDQDDNVRILAARALGILGPEARSAVPSLRRILKDGCSCNELRRAIEDALARIGEG